MDKSISELSPILKYTHGFLAGLTSRALFYPLDVAQTLMQVKADDAKDGVFPTLVHLYKTYGFSSWYRGFLPATLSVSTAGVGSFISREVLQNRNIQSWSFQGILFVSGVTEVALITILPLHVSKVRMITSPSKYKSTVECIQTIFDEEGPGALFRGLSASLLGWLPATAITYLSHEIFYRIFGSVPRGLWENIALGAITHILIGVVEYPILTAEAIRQSQVGEPDSVLKILIRTGKQEGIKGLYPGFSCILLKTPQRTISSFISRRTKVLFLKIAGFRANVVR